jgi:hypothetical protein
VLRCSVAGSAAAPRPLFSRESSIATPCRSARCVTALKPHLSDHQWRGQVTRCERGVGFRDLTGELGQCFCIGGCLRGCCVNATARIFCDVANCGSVNCWNRCQELPCLALVATRTGLGVASTLPLPPGINVGEYCGVLRRGAEFTRVMEQSGFGFKFAELSATGECIYIDASQSGSLCRFMNHACVANCRFEVMTNRCARKVVVVTCEFVSPVSELTVSYGR